MTHRSRSSKLDSLSSHGVPLLGHTPELRKLSQREISCCNLRILLVVSDSD